jgi:hypothetical protein
MMMIRHTDRGHDVPNNKPDAPNPAMTLQFHAGRGWHGVGEGIIATPEPSGLSVMLLAAVMFGFSRMIQAHGLTNLMHRPAITPPYPGEASTSKRKVSLC